MTNNNLRNDGTAPAGSNKLLVALVIAFAMLFVVDYLEEKYTPAEQAQAAVSPLTPTKGDLFSQKVAVEAKADPIDLTTDKYNAQIDLVGGKITKLEMLEYIENGSKPSFFTKINPFASDIAKQEVPDAPVQVFKSKTEDSKFAMLFDSGWLSNKFEVPDAATTWALENQKNNSISLSYTTNNLKFYRTFVFNDGNYLTSIEDSVVNNSSSEVRLAHYSQVHHIGERESKLANSFTNFTGPEALIDNEKVQSDYKELKDGKSFESEGKNIWAGITKMYFAGVIIPDNAHSNTVKMKHSKIGEDNYYTVLVRSNVKVLTPGQEITEKLDLYAGPKSINILDEQPVSAEIKLSTMLDYGWFHVIAKALYDGMMFINEYVGSLAISIVIITLLLKIALFPLANKSYVSMAKMRNIQPEMKALQEKYGNDRQTLSLEMMNLYKKHKVSPASGCWPIFLQIPIFFAMYKVILMSFEFRQAELGFWITDMSAKDPYFILPILMGLSMYIQQKLNPQPLDDTQKMVMNIMPVALTALFLFFPAGLVFYWLVNNIFSIAQQYIIMKREEK